MGFCDAKKGKIKVSFFLDTQNILKIDKNLETILVIGSVLIIVICFYFDRTYKTTFINFKKKANELANKDYHINLSIKITKSILEIIIIATVLNACSQENWPAYFLLTIYVGLYIALYFYEFLSDRTIEYREKNQMYEKDDSTKPKDEPNGNLAKQNSDKSTSNISSTIKMYGSEIRWTLILSGLYFIVKGMYRNKYILSLTHGTALIHTSILNNLYSQGGWLLMCGFFAWSFLSDQQKNNILFDIFRVLTLVGGIPIIFHTFSFKSVVWVQVFLIPICAFLIVRFIWIYVAKLTETIKKKTNNGK